MAIMHLLYTLSLFSVLSSSVFRLNAAGETEPEPITLKSGDIKNVLSPNYPENYNNNLNIRWGVRADLAQRIVVTFDDFHTEEVDYLYMEDKNYPSTGAKYSGSNAATPYISFGNHLAITFMSDFSKSNTGFNLSISCLKETDDTYIHEAFEGLEHTRVMTQPVCKDAWHTDVADTVCREAGFPGSYESNFISETENISESEGINYQCDKSTFRLQDCKTSTSRCIAQDSLVIVCNVLSELGCFDLAEYTHLLSRSVKLSRDQCLTHCKALSTTPQFAVHHSGTNCSCSNQTALDFTKLTEKRSRCMTNSESQTGHYATLFNVSLGLCSEPPVVDNGSWNNTSNGFMYGTTITAKCNDNYELVGGDGKIRCDKATTSTTRGFEWHGTIPSCQKRITDIDVGPADDESLSGSVTPTLASSKNTSKTNERTLGISLGVLIPVIIIIFVSVIVWIKRRKKEKNGDSLCLLAVGDVQQRDCRVIRFLRGFCGGTKSTSTVSRREDPEDQEPALQKIRLDFPRPSESII